MKTFHIECGNDQEGEWVGAREVKSEISPCDPRFLIEAETQEEAVRIAYEFFYRKEYNPEKL
jgi:hypothetical protein